MSGDVYGTGVFLVDGLNGVAGLWVEYEGGPGAPQPLTVERVGDTLHVSWPLPTRTEVDTALVRGDTLKFIGGSLRLVKQRSLPDVFSRADRTGCR